MRILFQIIWRAFLGTVGILVILGIVAAAYFEATLPSVEMLKDMHLQVPLRVYSSDSKLIAEFGEARRTPVTLNQVPKTLINAILATEDSRFYEHSGVDFRGLMRAGVNLLTNVSMNQGGSTITMQVARNYFLTRKKTFIRKLNEILLAFKIEKEFSKDEILELYLNKIYFGKRAYGVAAAAEVYYGTTIDRLTLDQIAMIAGLPQAPSSINPLHNKEAAYKRRKHVLERMLSYEYITQAQYDEAVNAPLPTKYHGRTIEVEAPYLAEMVRQDLFSRFGDSIYTLGYEVTTTLDSSQQAAANHALKRALLEYDQRHGYRKTKIHFNITRHKKPEDMLDAWVDELNEVPAVGNLLPGVVMRVQNNQVAVLLQDGRYITIPWAGLSWARPQFKNGGLGGFPRKASDIVKVGDVIYTQETENQAFRLAQVPAVGGALVALNPDTGSITALVGGFDYNVSSFNRVAQAERQPGSNFKPFLYAAGLSQGYTLASVINDAPLVYVDPVTGVVWKPQNSTKRFYGPTRLRVSLSRSQNMVTIRLLQAIGINNAINFIERFGFERSKLPPFLSLALGVGTATPLQVAAGYCAFANGGNRVTPNFIKKIHDYQGNLVHEATPPPTVNIMSPQVAYLITSALQEAIQTGTGQRARSLGRQDLAGKTGTTSDWVDAWYSGYNRDIVATSWVGFDDPAPLKEYGAMAALPMWMYFMEEVLKDKPEHAPPMPPGIITVKIDPATGRLAYNGQPNAIYEVFADNNLPGDNAATYLGEQEDSANSEALF